MGPDAQQSAVAVRKADGPSDAVALSRMLADYHAQTEAEKIAHGVRTPGPLPRRYAEEADAPLAAFAGTSVLLAERTETVVGMLVVAASEAVDTVELKRLWVEPAGRGAGVASALLAGAAAIAPRQRLSVWDWRTDAIGLYRARGFRVVPSWESRPRLQCFVRP